VAHAYNPSYSGSIDQKSPGWKPSWTNSSMIPYIKKKKSQKRAGGMAQGIDPEFKPQHYKKILEKT
jgi:hypothetical protein